MKSDFDLVTIEPRARDGGQEELRAVGVRASVGHGQQTWLVVLEDEVLVLELLAVDGLATGAVLTGEVTTLQHKVRDDTVERTALVAEALLAGAQGAEVLARARHLLRVQLHDNAAHRRTIGGHVKETSGHFRYFFGLG